MNYSKKGKPLYNRNSQPSEEIHYVNALNPEDKGKLNVTCHTQPSGEKGTRYSVTGHDDEKAAPANSEGEEAIRPCQNYAKCKGHGGLFLSHCEACTLEANPVVPAPTPLGDSGEGWEKRDLGASGSVVKIDGVDVYFDTEAMAHITEAFLKELREAIISSSLHSERGRVRGIIEGMKISGKGHTEDGCVECKQQAAYNLALSDLLTNLEKGV